MSGQKLPGHRMSDDTYQRWSRMKAGKATSRAEGEWYEKRKEAVDLLVTKEMARRIRDGTIPIPDTGQRG